MAISKIRLSTIPSSNENPDNIQTLSFDSVMNLDPTFTQKTTQYTTSDGMAISNNTTKSNNTITLTGYISNQPLTAYDNNIVGYSNLNDRPQKGYDVLKGWWNDVKELTVTTEYDVQSPMVITSLKPVQEGNDSLKFSITFEAMRTATYSRVILLENVSEDLETTGKAVTGGRGIKKDVTGQPQWAELERQFQASKQFKGNPNVQPSFSNMFK